MTAIAGDDAVKRPPPNGKREWVNATWQTGRLPCNHCPMRRLSFLFSLCVAMAGDFAVAAAPWHLDGWGVRAVVEIPQPLADAEVDTAGVKVLCQGHAKPDGSEYFVLDAAREAGAGPNQVHY